MKKHHLMIIDDDTDTLSLYEMILRSSPYKGYVRTEKNAEVALGILEDLNQGPADGFPDYILLDLSMPEMHGFDFIRAFEEKFPEKKDQTDFIIITSSVIRKDEEEAIRFPRVRDFLIKPVPVDYFQRLITEGYHENLRSVHK